MFVARVALLLLTALVLLEARKVQNVLKNVGKRAYWIGHTRNWEEMSEVVYKAKLKRWTEMSESEVNTTKYETAQRFMNTFLEVSSSEHLFFQHALHLIVDASSPSMTAEICGDEKTLNVYQYGKHMFQVGTQYKALTEGSLKEYTVVETAKDDLQVNMMFEQIDKNGIAVKMHYDVTMKALFFARHNDSIFVITHVKQGGSCLENGKVGYTSLRKEKDIEEYLQNHPDAKLFLNLFTPKPFQFSEASKLSDMSHLPWDWLLGLAPDAKIAVCWETQKDPVAYTKDQFQSLYQRFGQMWHPKKGDEEPVTVQILEMKDGIVNARITWKLQIGTKDDAKVNEWNFKIAAKVNEGTEPRWSINQIDVLCPSTISNLMDENYRAYRDVMGATFQLYISDKKQWYTATDFAKHFKKHGETVKVYSCDNEINDISDFPKYFWIRDRLWNATMIGYFLYDELDPQAAQEDTKVTLRMKMRGPINPPEMGWLFGADWTFHIKWDEMDQFYYVYKADFSCPGYLRPEDGRLMIFKAVKYDRY